MFFFSILNTGNQDEMGPERKKGAGVGTGRAGIRTDFTYAWRDMESTYD